MLGSLVKVHFVVLSILIALSVAHTANAQTGGRRSKNLLAAVTQPTEQQDESVKAIVKHLSTTQVPTWKDAEGIALSFLMKGPGLSAFEIWEVTGLYVLRNQHGQRMLPTIHTSVSYFAVQLGSDRRRDRTSPDCWNCRRSSPSRHGG
jgi:hypothetical protein